MKLIKTLLVMVVAFFLVYLLGAFASASFDISLWTAEARGLTALFGGVVGGFVGSIYLMES